MAHGPEFGEYRPVVPVGGGIPISRYYVPLLHSRVRYNDATQMFAAKSWLDEVSGFLTNVCDCAVCADTLDNDIENFVEVW